MTTTAAAPEVLPPCPADARQFRKLMRKLFDIGTPTVQLVGASGELRIVAAFGPHKVMLGAFMDAELDDVLRVVLGCKAPPPGSPGNPLKLPQQVAPAEGRS